MTRAFCADDHHHQHPDDHHRGDHEEHDDAAASQMLCQTLHNGQSVRFGYEICHELTSPDDDDHHLQLPVEEIKTRSAFPSASSSSL